jgi:hypothetical protein
LLHRPPIGVTSSASRCPEDDDDDEDELLLERPDELLPVEAAAREACGAPPPPLPFARAGTAATAAFGGCDAAPPSAICGGDESATGREPPSKKIFWLHATGDLTRPSATSRGPVSFSAGTGDSVSAGALGTRGITTAIGGEDESDASAEDPVAASCFFERNAGTGDSPAFGVCGAASPVARRVIVGLERMLFPNSRFWD